MRFFQPSWGFRAFLILLNDVVLILRFLVSVIGIFLNTNVATEFSISFLFSIIFDPIHISLGQEVPSVTVSRMFPQRVLCPSFR